MSSPDEQPELPSFPVEERPSEPRQAELSLPDIRERRVLVGYPDSTATRTIRLTLEGMRNISCDSSPSAEHTFERAMQYRYDLFIFALRFEDMSGDLLYSLIDKSYRFGDSDRVTAPAVLFMQEDNTPLPRALRSEPRVKGLLQWPFGMNELLEAIDRALPGTAPGRAIKQTHR